MLRCDAAEDLEALDVAYHAAFGSHLSITDSYRSYGAQVTCRATKGWLCATPGTSNHGTGIAVDLGGGIQSFGASQHLWMKEHADEFGWAHPAWARAGGSKPEAWHWEYVR
ncbi:D-alanyl-D-alanine carboxypeptidase family protein [Cellulomonas palmilytica]|nr:D-alanyl-D-alanine carboxypeptidase family protein [Cellulomonas palmilytica]